MVIFHSYVSLPEGNIVKIPRSRIMKIYEPQTHRGRKAPESKLLVLFSL